MITEVDLFSLYVNSHIRHYKTSAFVSLNFIRENNSKQQEKESRVRSCSFVHCLYKIDSFEKQVRKEKPYTWIDEDEKRVSVFLYIGAEHFTTYMGGIGGNLSGSHGQV